jgi:hypothetical protein
VIFGVAVATAIVLFAPAAVIARLGLDTLLSTYRPCVGGGFVLSAAIFASYLLAQAVRVLQPIALQRWNVRQWRKNLHYLSLPEQSLLAEYLDADSTTQCYFIGDGVVAGLIGKGILYRASNVGRPGLASFDHNIQPWAWEYLKRHPELVAAGRGRARDV